MSSDLKNAFLSLLLGIVALLTASPPFAAENPPRAEWVPPGFEALNEPQVTEVDIWYGGYFLTSSLARFTIEELQFLDPDAIVQQIPNIKDSEIVLELLSISHPTNNALVCRSTFEVECGTLTTEAVEIIFDRDTFRVALFVGSDLLSVSAATQSRYLPDSSGALSAYSENNLYFSGEENQPLVFNFSNSTQIALAESRLLLRNNWTDTEGFVFDTLGLQRDYQGRNTSFGLIRGNAGSFDFINSEQFLGVSFESSLSTRADLDSSYGSEIFLFFASRSLVEVYRDNRLLYSGYYDVGNHVLETSTLPSGSYDIEIRVTDLAGNTTIEERFYSKSARLAPNDQPLYFLQLGNLVSADQGSLVPQKLEKFARAGYSARLSPTLGAGIGYSGIADSSLVELSVFKMGKNFELSSALAYESSGTFGLSSDLRLNFSSIDLDIGTRQILESGEDDKSLAITQIGASRNEYRANLGFQSPIGRMNLFYRSNERERYLLTDIAQAIALEEASASELNSRNYGVRWSMNAYRIGPGQFRASAEVSRNNDESLLVLGVTYSLATPEKQFSVSPRFTDGTDPTGKAFRKLEGSSAAEWRLGDDAQNRMSVRGYKQDQSILEANLRTAAFNSLNDVSARYDLDVEKFSYNGSLSSSLATTSNARAFGNSQNGESAFLVNIESIPGDLTLYEVLVNGSPRGKTLAGQTLLVPVEPYETYRVEVVAKGDSLVNLKESSFVRTVYPGNVIALAWSAQVVKVGYGRILDKEGLPIANAVLSRPGGISITDEQGFFQIEISQDDDSFELRKGTDSCIVSFTQSSTAGQVIPLGELRCDTLF
jgi:Mat/Ecp fimbriae outer membrane usher protein